MKKTISFSLTVIALTIFVNLAHADDKPALILGAGADSCASYTEAFSTMSTSIDTDEHALNRLQYITWIQGFASAATQVLPRAEKKLSKQGQVGAMLNRISAECSKNPNQKIADALSKVLLKM